MPKYMVTGADRETGEDRSLEVTAADEGSASEVAAEQGILVHRIYPMSKQKTIDDTANHDADEPVNGTMGASATTRPGRSGPGTIGIAVGVAAGLLLAGAAKWLMAGVFIVTSSGAARPTNSTEVFVPAELMIVEREEVPPHIALMKPMSPGDGPPSRVSVRPIGFQVFDDTEFDNAVFWTVSLRNPTGIDQVVRITPALIEQNGLSRWHLGKGYKLLVPPGEWTFRSEFSMPKAVYKVKWPDGYYRW